MKEFSAENLGGSLLNKAWGMMKKNY